VNQSLQKLCLNENYIGVEGVVALVNTLRVNQSLQMLDLGVLRSNEVDNEDNNENDDNEDDNEDGNTFGQKLARKIRVVLYDYNDTLYELFLNVGFIQRRNLVSEYRQDRPSRGAPRQKIYNWLQSTWVEQNSTSAALF
jgi:hypothetical protein